MQLRVLGFFAVVFLAAAPAHAGMFAGVGNVFKSLGRSLVEDLGVPVTFLSVAWGLLAIKFRLGGMQWAVTGILAGVALMNSEALVDALWSAAAVLR